MGVLDPFRHTLGALGDVIDTYGLSLPLLVSVIAGLLGLAIYINFFITDSDYIRPARDPKLPPPTEVVSLRIYPIKSCRGIEVKESRLKTSGLDLDRNWMFVDAADNKFLTIRSDPTMTLINTSINEDTDELTISVQGSKTSVTVPAHPTKAYLEEHNKLEQVEIWEEPTDAWAYPSSINDLFNAHFKKPVKLVFKGPSARVARGNADPSLYGKSVSHHFADLMSVQIASESSLHDLNHRLKGAGYQKEELTIERFRPNIIVKGNDPWEEDRWKSVRINTVEPEKEMLWRVGLDVVCRCARCQVPNVNPDTAEKDKKEPWDTLMKFRRVDEGGPAKWKPCFGMLCVPQKEGPVKVGSMLEVMELTEKHLYNKAKFAEL